MDDPFCPRSRGAIREAAQRVPGFRFRRVHGPREASSSIAGWPATASSRSRPAAELEVYGRLTGHAGHHRRLRQPGAGPGLRDAPRLLPRRRELGRPASRPRIPPSRSTGCTSRRCPASRPRSSWPCSAASTSRPRAAAGRSCGRGRRSTRGRSPRRRERAPPRAPPPLLGHGAGGGLLSARPPHVTVHAARMRLPATTPADEVRMLDAHVLPAAADLATIRPDVVVFSCTSAGRAAGPGLRGAALRGDRPGGGRARRQHDARGAGRAGGARFPLGRRGHSVPRGPDRAHPSRPGGRRPGSAGRGRPRADGQPRDRRRPAGGDRPVRRRDVPAGAGRRRLRGLLHVPGVRRPGRDRRRPRRPRRDQQPGGARRRAAGARPGPRG